MSLSLLLPAALSSLLALGIPLLLHLARREQQRRTVFAALRWLRARPRPRRRIRFDEWPLLLLRLMLLALLALWLAHPVLIGTGDRTPWIAVAPDVDPAAASAAVQGEAAEVRWLAPGFPAVDTPLPAASRRPPLASLLRELDARLPADAPLRVVVPASVAGLDGAVVSLSRDVDWQVIESGAAKAADAVEAEVFDLAIRHAPGQADAFPVRALRAAALALRDSDAADAPLDVADAQVPLDAGTQRLAWLAPGTLPAGIVGWIEGGGDALLAFDVEIVLPETTRRTLWRDVEGVALIEEAPLGAGRMMRLLQPMTPDAMPQLLDPGFPQHLRALFDATPAPGVAHAHEVAPTRSPMAWPVAPRDLRPWLALLIALLVLAERWLATSMRREVRP
ncbi:hypothetical protein E2F46_07605 [Luteimonas aestuarii]|uniref:Aerotolerance regulator N-terminal domain-containing protein n=1 Tax=Luteimonas aestuarii TaxID=453837 RepID=A0A4R5TVD1_9GAMM|nr:BatA domain-containing protein [Luteimonas aestuarii]TDK25028.1 hypothetical protein E2F46_07605 [Luteimonas aestuarii]